MGDYRDNLLYGNFITYDRMYRLSMWSFCGLENIKDVFHIGVYIDMMSMVKMLYNNNIGNYIPRPDMIASCMINLCAHIRAYYHTRHRVHTEIFIVYGTNRPEYVVQKIPYYNAHSEQNRQAKSLITQAIDEACGLMDIICKYLPDIHFIRDNVGTETSVIMHDIMQNIAHNPINVVYSKDRFAYQLVANNKQTFVFRPRFTNSEFEDRDRSYSVTKSNLLFTYRVIDLKAKTAYDKMTDISPQLFPLLLSLTGFRFRNIPMAFGPEGSVCSIRIGNSVKLIRALINSNQIINGYNNSFNLRTIDVLKPEVMDEFINRYECLDLISQHMRYISEPICLANRAQVAKNLYDPESVKAVNNQYFREYPLDLERL